MDPEIKLSYVESFITAINVLLNVNLSITGDDVKVAVTALCNAYETKYFTQRTTFTTTTFTPSVSTNSVRRKNAWRAIANVSRQNTSVSSLNF